MRRLMLVLVVLLAAASMAAAQAEPARRDAREAAGNASSATTSGVQAGAAARGPDYGIPPLPYDPGNQDGWGGTFDVANTVGKSKITLTLKAQKTLTYAHVCVALVFAPGDVLETCCPDPAAATCFKINPPPTSDDKSGLTNWFAITGPTWIESPRNVSPTHGIFAPVDVQALAFGSIPVTAKAYLTQVRRPNGLFRPLALDYRIENNTPPQGTTIPGYEPSPDPQFIPKFYLPATVQGDLQIRLGDVRVDGRPVDVGNSCRTGSPATLKMGAPGGWANSNGPDSSPKQRRGRPGEFQTVPGSSMQGNITIPAFTGCRQGSENLDPLISSFASGPNNPISVELQTTLNSCSDASITCAPFPKDPAPNLLTGQRRPTGSAVAVSRTAVPVNKTFQALTASQRAVLVRNIARATPQVRSAALAALPQLADAVRAHR